MAATRPLSPGQRQAISEVRGLIEKGVWQFENVACPCGGRNFRVIALQDRFSLPAPISACRACGLLQANPRLTAAAYHEFYASYYRRIYAGWEPDVVFAQQEPRGRTLKTWLERMARLTFGSGDKVIEIGCGAGGILAAFAADGCEVAGCDFDPRFLAFGRSKGIDLREGDASCLAAVGPARLVILSHVFEHFTDPLGELRRIRQLLRPDGFVLIQVPGITFEIMQYQHGGHKLYDFLDYAQNAHAYHFDRPELLALVVRAGFEPLASDDEITAVFRPRPEAATDAPPVAAPAGADASLAQLTRLRKVEQRRRLTGWAESSARAAIHGVRRSTLNGLRKTPLKPLFKALLRR